ncbi:MAG: hypothetical protein V2I27_09045 [Erythrobacter sp.]|nr:hypothetical protein [Erythrobacter sp.]
MRIVTFSALSALSLALAACGSESSGTIEGENGERGEYTIDQSTGETKATIRTDEGTATLRSGADVEVDLPAGFTAYPGATIVSNTVVNQAQGSGSMLFFETDDPPADVIAFYKRQAEAAGVDIQLDATINGGAMIGGENPDGLTFSVNANPGEERTSAQLIVGNKGE